MRSRISRFPAIAAGIMAVLAAVATAQSWTRASGIDSTRATYALEKHDGAWYATSDTLVYRSVDGIAWQQTASQPAPGSLIYGTLQSHATGLYLGTYRDGVFRTTNGGQSWIPAGAGLPEGDDVVDLAVLGDSLFAGLGFSGIYVMSLASPGAWTSYTTGLTQFGANSVSTVGSRLYAGLGAGFFVRARGAFQWAEIDLGAQRQIYDVVGRDGVLYAATSNGVYKMPSPDSAWRSADIGPMAGNSISALAFQGNRLFAGLNYRLEHWIWSTDDGGAVWDVRAHEFAEIVDLRADGGRLLAARTDGLWILDLDPVAVERSARHAGAPGLRTSLQSIPGGARVLLTSHLPPHEAMAVAIVLHAMDGRVVARRSVKVLPEQRGVTVEFGSVPPGLYSAHARWRGGASSILLLVVD